MRIPCPYCGERSNAEFTYLGDASPLRPRDARAPTGQGAAPLRDMVDYVYVRGNPPGVLREWWQHTGGCRAWLMVERDVSTHAVGSVVPARQSRNTSR